MIFFRRPRRRRPVPAVVSAGSSRGGPCWYPDCHHSRPELQAEPSAPPGAEAAPDVTP